MSGPTALLYDTYYHIYNRGNNRENIFIQERNYRYFLELYFKHIEPVAETFAYCLLRNHFHLLVRVKSEEEILTYLQTLKVSPAIHRAGGRAVPANQEAGGQGKPLGSFSLEPGYPSKKFSDFFNAYAKAINKAYGRTGSLFEHPFHRVPVTSERQFWNVITYIHQNPQKHRFVPDFRTWEWSSYGILVAGKPTKLSREAVLDRFGGRQAYLDLHESWVAETDSRWFAEDDCEA